MIQTIITFEQLFKLYTDVLSMMKPEEARWMFVAQTELTGDHHSPLFVMCFKNSQNNKVFNTATYIGSDDILPEIRKYDLQDMQDLFRKVKYQYLGIKG